MKQKIEDVLELVDGFRFKFQDMWVYFTVECYGSRRLALKVNSSDEGPIGCLTVNLPDSKLGDGEFFVKTWAENEELAKAAMDTKLFQDTGRTVATGYVLAEVWRFAEGAYKFMQDNGRWHG